MFTTNTMGEGDDSLNLCFREGGGRGEVRNSEKCLRFEKVNKIIFFIESFIEEIEI